MGPFAAAPGIDEREDRKPAGVDCESGAEAMAQVSEADVTSAQSDFCLIGGEKRSDGKLAKRVLDGASKEEQVRTAEAIVGIAGQDGRAVEIGAANSKQEEEKHQTPKAGERLRDEDAKVDGAFEFSRERDLRTGHGLV